MERWKGWDRDRLEPDADVNQQDLAWWLAQEERLEIRAQFATSGLL